MDTILILELWAIGRLAGKDINGNKTNRISCSCIGIGKSGLLKTGTKIARSTTNKSIFLKQLAKDPKIQIG